MTSDIRTHLSFEISVWTASRGNFGNGREIRLQPCPPKLLVLLATRRGEVVDRAEIPTALWGDDTFDTGFRVESVHSPAGGRCLRGERGRGFLPFSPGVAIVGYMATLKVELSKQLHERLHELVAQGWFSSESDVVQEAVRRFLEAHAPEMMSRFIEEDVEWGLRGSD